MCIDMLYIVYLAHYSLRLNRRVNHWARRAILGENIGVERGTISPQVSATRPYMCPLYVSTTHPEFPLGAPCLLRCVLCSASPLPREDEMPLGTAANYFVGSCALVLMPMYAARLSVQA